MSTPLHCDVAVIGAGTAGLAAERAARRNGASTVLIDPHFSGTTCANFGCMPSKLLLAAARQAERVRRSDLFGIRVEGMTIDDVAVMRRVREERDRFAALTRKQIDKLDPATRLTGRARFAAPTTLELDDGRRIEARAIVIATGSAPALPPPFEALGDRVLTNESLFELKQLPKRLAVVGAGSLGLEFAQALARLGVQVTLLSKETTLAKVRCPRVHDALLAVLKRDMEVHLGVDVAPSDAMKACACAGAARTQQMAACRWTTLWLHWAARPAQPGRRGAGQGTTGARQARRALPRPRDDALR